ncbi:MAG: hypothetical protein HC778_01180 [Chamaesiphon sp. CSU_1_12]|nr:hypothetical protein [Chamaesiphon sp. CSU_1_12]
MANPFFSGRIPPGLADKIDAHLLTTGETRSELLIRLLRAEVDDSDCDNINDNISDNALSNLIARVEKLERAINNKPDNKTNAKNDNNSDNKLESVSDNNADNTNIDRSDWMDLSTIAAKLGVLPKSISGAGSKRGRKIHEDMIEFEIAGRKIQKKGSGFKALYRNAIPLTSS